ncbi:MAG: VWA domain-containing protein [Acidobacteriota bacterium]|nr:VWA domain-containing protein [Acidobacteriota bacterium]
MVTWTAPAALWLAAAVPLVWVAHLFARTRFNRRQRWLQAVVRSLILMALAAALARPLIATSSSRQSIVYAVDVSHSVSGTAIEAAARRIDDLNGVLQPAHFRILAFGLTATVLEGTPRLRQLVQLEATAPGTSAIDRRGTDLEAALDAARGELATGHVPRIVLFTDGRATGGDTDAAIARVIDARIPVSVEPLATRALGDTWIDSLDLPDRIPAGAPFTASIAVGSQRGGQALVELLTGGKVLATVSIVLTNGVTQVPVSAVLAASGGHVIQAAVRMPGDPLADNNTLERGMWADPRTKVLYVERITPSARYLADALTASGFHVTVRQPSGLPSTESQLDPYDVVVLSDVPRSAFSAASMSALQGWVETGGGGLLVAGGEAVFGEGGYRHTPIERLAPVTFERREEPEVALVLVLDRSWSMAGASMDLCKAAAQAAVDVMTDEQALGVLTFNDKFDWDITLRGVGANRDDIRRKIAAIEPGGHTLIFPAVEQAYLALSAAKARAKHVVLLSDGRSYPDDYETLVSKMASARITVSTVAVGPSADPELLRNIARWGKGRAYQVADAKELPQIFVKEARNAATASFDEKQITAVVKTPAFLSGVDLTRIPRLKGRTATVIKESALEILTTDEGDPLLAFWPTGLGRTAVFASDVKDRWAANWVTWRGYGPFFTAVVRALERRRPAASTLDVVPGPIQGGLRSVAIAVEARDANGRYHDLLHPVAQVRVADGTPRDIPLRQVAPGRYESTLVADARTPLSVRVAGEPDAAPGVAARFVLPDAAAEYRFGPADEARLRAVASATGGAWRPGPEALTTDAADRRTERRPLWSMLIALALGLWFVDVLLRRVRIFEASAG